MIDAPSSMQLEQVIAQKLVACGLDRGAVSVVWHDELQSKESVIRRDAHASSDQFACIHKAAVTDIAKFEEPSLQSAYSDYAVELYRPRMIAEIKAAVKKWGCPMISKSAHTLLICANMPGHSNSTVG